MSERVQKLLFNIECTSQGEPINFAVSVVEELLIGAAEAMQMCYYIENWFLNSNFYFQILLLVIQWEQPLTHVLALRLHTKHTHVNNE